MRFERTEQNNFAALCSLLDFRQASSTPIDTNPLGLGRARPLNPRYPGGHGEFDSVGTGLLIGLLFLTKPSPGGSFVVLSKLDKPVPKIPSGQVEGLQQGHQASGQLVRWRH